MSHLVGLTGIELAILYALAGAVAVVWHSFISACKGDGATVKTCIMYTFLPHIFYASLLGSLIHLVWYLVGKIRRPRRSGPSWMR
jgi:hypothetical protein